MLSCLNRESLVLSLLEEITSLVVEAKLLNNVLHIPQDTQKGQVRLFCVS